MSAFGSRLSHVWTIGSLSPQKSLRSAFAIGSPPSLSQESTRCPACHLSPRPPVPPSGASRRGRSRSRRWHARLPSVPLFEPTRRHIEARCSMHTGPRRTRSRPPAPRTQNMPARIPARPPKHTSTGQKPRPIANTRPAHSSTPLCKKAKSRPHPPRPTDPPERLAQTDSTRPSMKKGPSLASTAPNRAAKKVLPRSSRAMARRLSANPKRTKPARKKQAERGAARRVLIDGCRGRVTMKARARAWPTSRMTHRRARATSGRERSRRA